MTPKEKFIENCKKLAESDKLARYYCSPSNGYIEIKRSGVTIPFQSPDEFCLRQLIYHEFGYDVEIAFVGGNGFVKLRCLKPRDFDYMEINVEQKHDLSHWTDGLVEVFNRLMSEKV